MENLQNIGGQFLLAAILLTVPYLCVVLVQSLEQRWDKIVAGLISVMILAGLVMIIVPELVS